MFLILYLNLLNYLFEAEPDIEAVEPVVTDEPIFIPPSDLPNEKSVWTPDGELLCIFNSKRGVSEVIVDDDLLELALGLDCRFLSRIK